jgi:putative membrane protein
LLTVFIIAWIILAFNVNYRDEWVIENLLNVPFVILLIVLSKWFKLSKLSYSCIFIFMMMNVIGSHYTYAEVPFGFWLQDFLGASRNHYDRIVHFSFGLLFAYPMRELFIRIGGSRGFWAWWMPIELVFGLSAVYEILEWWVAIIWGGDLGVAYLGSQGDVWDAQWDMFLAGTGAFIAMTIVLIVLFSYEGKKYLIEFKESLRVREKNPLGERALEKLQRKL